MDETRARNYKASCWPGIYSKCVCAWNDVYETVNYIPYYVLNPVTSTGNLQIDPETPVFVKATSALFTSEKSTVHLLYTDAVYFASNAVPAVLF